MSGAVTWQLVESVPDLIVGCVAVAASYPGNIAPTSEVALDDGRVIEAVFGSTGVRFRVDRERAEHYTDRYIFDQAIAASTHFPPHLVEPMRMGLIGIPPRMLIERLGLEGGLPSVRATATFDGLPVRLVAGSEDPAHTRAIEAATVDLLRSWGADAELVWLSDRGVEGNGHFLFFEDNSDLLLDIVEEQIVDIMKAGSGREDDDQV
jgi:pimeloyl-ACP methyl ester carboxylesterase